jgi:ArsR family transcriptional regulator
MKNLANIFKALSDETRLSMLALLIRRGELCVCDFVEVMRITQSKASRHLRYLLNAGLLRDRRQGVWVYYRIAGDATGDPKAVLRAAKEVLNTRSLDDLEHRLDTWIETKKKTGGLCPAPVGRQRGGRS